MFEILFCTHKSQTTPRRDDEGEYRRCLECGARIPWAMPEDGVVIRPPILTQLGKRQLAEAWRRLFEGDPLLPVSERMR